MFETGPPVVGMRHRVRHRRRKFPQLGRDFQVVSGRSMIPPQRKNQSMADSCLFFQLHSAETCFGPCSHPETR